MLLKSYPTIITHSVSAGALLCDATTANAFIASTGALLLSSNGGSRGWAYKYASFNPNAAVTLRILARRIASGNGGYYK